MKKPVVDYRGFRLSRINEPQFSHLKLLVGWIVYFALYFITEKLIPMEKCHVVHCRLDDLVPFCEYFVIAYTFWYFLIAGSLLYFALYNLDGFRKLSTYIIITQIAAMVIYIIFPNRQDLRPETFERSNICTYVLQWIYAFDTSSNVCPSLHVAYSLGIASTWLKDRDVHWGVKLFVALASGLICVSVAFVKQHSVVDIFAALPICLLAEILVFRGYWRDRFHRSKAA